MAFKLNIGNIIDVPVDYIHNPGGGAKKFKFKIQAERIEADAAADLVAGKGDFSETKIPDFLREKVTGWSGQTIVVDAETDKPLEFSAETFNAMLSVTGVAMAIFQSYMAEIVGKSGEAARQKN